MKDRTLRNLFAVTIAFSLVAGSASAATKTTKKKAPTTKAKATTTKPAATPSVATTPPVLPATARVEQGPAVTRTLPADGDANGTLKLGFDMVNIGGMRFDNTKIVSPTQTPQIFQVWEPLLHYENETGEYTPGLALDAKVIDGTTIDVTLRPNVKFQNGEPVDVKAVEFGIKRAVAANNAGGTRIGELRAFKEVIDKGNNQLSIKLSTPTAGSFFNLLAYHEALPMPPKAMADNPDLNKVFGLGSGPFRITEFVPESNATLTKSDTYWNAANIRVKTIQWRHLVGADATVLALRTGDVHGAIASKDVLDQLKGAGLQTRSFVSPDTVYWLMGRCDRFPVLQDIRVRQAINYATDGLAIARAVFGESGTRMTDYFSSGKFHNPNLQGYRRDVNKAKQLLAEAGQSNLNVRVIIAPGGGTPEFVSSMLQQQWKEAGINLSIVVSTDTVTDFVVGRAPTEFFINLQTRIWTDKVFRTFSLAGGAAFCSGELFKDQVYIDAMAKLRSVDPRSDDALTAWHTVQKQVHDGAWGVFMGHGATNLVWNNKVGDIAWNADQVGATYFPDAYRVYVKK